MKWQLTILLLAASFTAAAQKHPIKDRYAINSTNHPVFYQQARHLITLNNPDSSLEATCILRALLFYDTTTYSIDLFQPLLDRIENANRLFYQTTLGGSWKFEWSGSNWGTAQTFEDLQQTVVFTGREVFFYHGDTLVRKTAWRLSNDHPLSLFSTVNFFRLVFEDNGDEWALQFYSRGYVPYIGSTATIAMRINEMPNCVCGCPESIYSKITGNSLVVR